MTSAGGTGERGFNASSIYTKEIVVELRAGFLEQFPSEGPLCARDFCIETLGHIYNLDDRVQKNSEAGNEQEVTDGNTSMVATSAMMGWVPIHALSGVKIPTVVLTFSGLSMKFHGASFSRGR